MESPNRTPDSQSVLPNPVARNPISDNSGTEIDLIQVARTLWRRRWIMLSTAMIAGIAAFFISYLLPKTYSAEATILPLSDSDPAQMLSAGVANQLGAAAGMLGNFSGLAGIGGGRSADLVEFLSSRSMTNRVIAACQLETEIKGWRSREELTKMVTDMRTIIPPSLKNKVVTIKVQAPRSELAARMANAYVGELKTMLDEMGYNSASKNRKFIQKQLSHAKSELAIAEEKLARFQTENHLASLPETVLSSIRALSELEAQSINTQVQLSSTAEMMETLTTKIDSLQAAPSAMTELELKRKGLTAQKLALEDAQRSFLSKLTQLPPKGMELARLQRDVQVYNAIYLTLTQQHETALISENKDSDSFYPLDQAVVPDRPLKPNKKINTLVAFIGALVFSAAFVLRREYLASARNPQSA